MFVLRELLLLCSIFLCISSAKPPKEGQRCEAEGETGKCVKWSNCAPIAEILRRKPVKEPELIYAQKFICGYKRNTPYHCCVPGLSAAQPGAPELPPQPQTPDRSDSSEEEKNIKRNALMNHRNNKLLPLQTCGMVEHNYIVGGEQASLGEYPWLAIIHYKHKTQSIQDFKCGGALINRRYVLTAAHCLHPDKIRGFYPDMVRLGENNLNTDPDTEHGKEGRKITADPVMDIMIERTIMHRNYLASNLNQFHDIGLIRLNRDVPETRYVKTLCLPTPEIDGEITPSNSPVTVAGWGNTESGSRSSLLMWVEIPMVDTNTCARAYSRLKRNVTFTQLCAGVKGKDSCGGDSGGPLMGTGEYSNYKGFRYFAVGLVSFGHTICGIDQYPGVYTRVLPYVGWILDQMKP